ncbi:MAG: heavy metal-associated domain-containing protein [Cytophagales bacterium]|nr:heavy metal-associated domain-containing protein [Cytophagales bacterium]
MKNSIKKITVALTLVGLSSLTFATTTVLTVNGMVCAFCAQGIEKRLSKLPEIKGVFVDLKKKIVAVEAKDGMTLDKTLLQSEIKDAGYDVTKVEDTDRTIAAVKADAKGKK